MRFHDQPSRFSGGSLTQWTFLLTLFLLFILTPTAINSADCNKAKRDWLSYRYKVMVGNPHSPGYGQDLCPIPDGTSCCDKQMEQDIFAVSERELPAALATWLLPIAEQMEKDSVSLDYYFKSDLVAARNRLHEAFSGIYGYNYKVNHAFFFQFYTDLDSYMAGRRNNLRELLDTFFNQLRTHIVVLMEKADTAMGSPSPPPTGGHQVSDPARIKCLSDGLGRHEEAFGDIYIHLRDKVLEAYPPARMLANTLAAGSKLMRTVVEEASVRPDCLAAFARFRYCGTYCGAREGPTGELCPAACDSFATACFSPPSASQTLPVVWPQLINAVTTVTKRLERSFNFAGVNKEMHIYISEAVTNVHLKYAQVKHSLQQKCASSDSQSDMPVSSPNRWPFASSGRHRRSINDTDDSDAPIIRTKRQQQPFGGGGYWQQHPSPNQPQPQAFPQPGQGGWGAPPSLMMPHPGGGGYPQRGGGGYQQTPPQHQPPPQPMNFQPSPLGGGLGGMGGAAAGGGGGGNARDRLNQWAVQLKSFYSGLTDVFNRPPSTVCPAITQPNKECWNPPAVQVSPSQRHAATVSELATAASRLNQVASGNSNNEDPDALELGAETLAAGRQNSSANSPQPHQSPPSLLRERNPPAFYPPQSMQSGPQAMDSWGAQAGGAGAGGYLPPTGSNPYYQPHPDQFPDQLGAGGMEGSGFGPGPGEFGPPQQPPQPGQYAPLPQPGGPDQPQQPPSPGHWQPQPVPPEQPGAPDGGVAPDTSDSGSGQYGPDPWGHVPPPGPPQPGQPVDAWGSVSPSPGGGWEQPGGHQWQPDDYYGPPPPPPDQQQGSGEQPFLPGPEAFQPQPATPPVAVGPDDADSTPTTTTTSSPMDPITPQPDLGTPPSPPAVQTPSTNRTQDLPKPPPVLPGGFDDEDFGAQPTPATTTTTSTTTTSTVPQKPSEGEKPAVQPPPQPPHLPYPPEGPGEASGYPEPGGMDPLGPPHPMPSPHQPILPDTPPDCSPEAMAAAGSAVDPRCLGQPLPPQPPIDTGPWAGPDAEVEGSGGRGEDHLEPPPPPYPGYDGGMLPPTHPQPFPDGGIPGYPPYTPGPPFPPRPDVVPSAPPTSVTKAPSVGPGVPPHRPPPPRQPSRALPPDIWIPAPGPQPGGKLPDSKYFMPDFPYGHAEDRGDAASRGPGPLPLLLLFLLVSVLVH